MMNWHYRKPKKMFVPINVLYGWAIRLDTSDHDEAALYNMAIHFFAEAVKLFNGTYTYETIEKDENGETIYKYYPNLGITETDMLDYFLNEYGERLAGKAFKPYGINPITRQERDEFSAMAEVLCSIYNKCDFFVKANKYKYLTMVKTTGIPYNPIENYRMVEEGSDQTLYGKNSTKTGNITDTPTGTSSTQRTIDAAQVDHIIVEGPILLDANSQFKPTVDQGTGKMTISEIGFAPTKVSTSSASARTAGSEQGGTVGTTTSSISIDGSTATINATSTIGEGSTPTATNYGTTYDDNSSEGSDRKLGKATQTGTVGEAENTSATSSTDRIVNGRIEAGNPAAFGYTDTESFTNRVNTKTYNNVKDQDGGTDTTSHTLTRSGNIGVTTTQQMLESERELANFNILKDFFDELSKEILLGVYDY